MAHKNLRVLLARETHLRSLGRSVHTRSHPPIWQQRARLTLKCHPLEITSSTQGICLFAFFSGGGVEVNPVPVLVQLPQLLPGLLLPLVRAVSLARKARRAALRWLGLSKKHGAVRFPFAYGLSPRGTTLQKTRQDDSRSMGALPATSSSRPNRQGYNDTKPVTSPPICRRVLPILQALVNCPPMFK